MPARTRLANDAWEALLSAHAALMKEFLADDIWDEISMREYDVLYTLSKAARPLRLGELNEEVLLSQPALSRLVDRLTANGLLERREDPSDRRCALVALTDEGIALQRRVGRRHARTVAGAVTRGLSVEEMERLEAIAGKLARTSREPRSSTRRKELQPS